SVGGLHHPAPQEPLAGRALDRHPRRRRCRQRRGRANYFPCKIITFDTVTARAQPSLRGRRATMGATVEGDVDLHAPSHNVRWLVIGVGALVVGAAFYFMNAYSNKQDDAMMQR